MPLSESAKARLAPWFSQRELDAFAFTERGLISWVFRHVLRAGAVTWNGVVNFARARYSPETATGLAIIAHELVHVRQQREMGWIPFLLNYLWLLRKRQYRTRLNRNHPLEQPAYALQREVLAALQAGERATAEAPGS